MCPFRGGGPAMNDLVAGYVPSLIASAPTATAFMREGRIRALAVTGAKRSPFDPEIPTIAEQGFLGYAATNWHCIVVSSKVPPEIVATLNTIITRALKVEEVQAAYGRQGMETLASTAAEASAHIARETEIWKKVIADAGHPPDQALLVRLLLLAWFLEMIGREAFRLAREAAHALQACDKDGAPAAITSDC